MTRLDENMEKLREIQLDSFERDNERYRRRNKRVPLAERAKKIDESFPSVKTLDWHDVLKVDEEGLPEGIFAWLLRDILKLDATPAGKDGPRAELTYAQEVIAWRRATGQDYSERPFHEAFAILARDDTYSTIARKTNISRSRVFRLKDGAEPPDVEDMRLIAKAYGKDPSYFREFRAEYVMAVIARRLMDDPEQTAVVFRRLVRAT